MILSGQKTIMKWHARNKDYYESLGYIYTKMGDEFEVDVNDLPRQSHAWVRVQCDFCGDIIDVKYQNYINRGQGSDGYACTKCKHKKAAKSVKNIYGVDNVFKTDEVKKKSESTCLKKYNETRYQKTLEFRSSIAAKVCQGFYKNGTGPTSKPQNALRDALREIYGECELNYPCGRCCLDCMIVVDGIRIDVEFDGQHWHKDEDKDRRRDEFVKSQGYKVLRILGNNEIPSKEDLIEVVQKLVTTNSLYHRMTTDIK